MDNTRLNQQREYFETIIAGQTEAPKANDSSAYAVYRGKRDEGMGTALDAVKAMNGKGSNLCKD